MSSPHVFYIVTRVVFELASVALALKLGRDLYADRANLSELWRAPRSYKSSRMLRVAGFLDAIIGIIIHIDFHGVYGILDPLAVVILLWVALGVGTIAIHITIYHELIATLPFIGVVNFVNKRRLQIALALFAFIHVSLYCGTFFVNNRVFLFVGSVSMALYGLIFVLVINSMHLLIRRHYRTMEKAQLKCYIGQTARCWTKALLSWRLYTITLTAGLLTGVVWVGIGLLHPANRERTRIDINRSINPSTIPNLEGILFPFILLFMTLGSAVRSQTHGKKSSSKKPSTGADTSSSAASTADRKGGAKASELNSNSNSAAALMINIGNNHEDTSTERIV